MVMENITLKINNQQYKVRTEPDKPLLRVLRELGFKGVKEGCGTGECGACSIIFDKKIVCSCLIPVKSAEGHDIITIEGINNNGKLHPIQEAFIEAGAVQCGFCSPGFILSAYVLLEKNPNPTDQELKEAVSGNLCRCTGYTKIVEAIRIAAEKMQKAKKVGDN